MEMQWIGYNYMNMKWVTTFNEMTDKTNACFRTKGLCTIQVSKECNQLNTVNKTS